MIYKYPENLDLSLLRYFLRGYIDGDGSIGSYYKAGDIANKIPSLRVSFVGTHAFIKRCVDLIPMNGFSIAKNRNIACGCIVGWKAVEFCKWLYKEPENIEIPRYYKEGLYNSHLNTFGHTRFQKFLDLELKASSILMNNEMTAKEFAEIYKVGLTQVYRWKSRNFINPSFKEFF